MSISLKLYHKAFILVAVPLAFQLIVFGFFFQTLIQVEQELARESRATEINYHLNKLNYTLLEAARHLKAAEISGLKYFETVEKAMQDSKAEFAALRRLVTTPSENAVLDNMEETVLYAHALILELERDARKGKKEDARHHLRLVVGITGELSLRMLDVTKKYKDITEKLGSMTGTYDRIAKESSKKQEEARRMLTLFMALSAFNMVLATSLLFVYNKDITRRLQVLMDNTFKFVKGEPLNAQVQGTDEIAHLDKTFHDMASVVAAAARQKQEFTAMITHDLRTPLTSVKGGLTLLENLSKDSLNAESLKLMKTMEHSTEIMIKLINDLLDIEKLEAGKMEMVFEDVPLAYVLEHSLEAVRFLAQKKSVRIEAPSTELELRADGDRLVQVLINLLSNAIKYSPKDGLIIVSLKQEGSAVELRVTDQGPGIPPEYKDKLFERFQQVALPERRSYGGTGLGLAICKEIIAAHDGTVGVESEGGNGSTFWFRIPCRAHLPALSAEQHKLA